MRCCEPHFHAGSSVPAQALDVPSAMKRPAAADDSRARRRIRSRLVKEAKSGIRARGRGPKKGAPLCSPPPAPPRALRLWDLPVSPHFCPARLRNGDGDPIGSFSNRVPTGLLSVSRSARCVSCVLSRSSCDPPLWDWRIGLRSFPLDS